MTGLSSTGFEAKTLPVILEDIATRLKATFGSGTDTTVDEVVMLIVDAIAIEIKENWNGAQLQYDFLNPANAEGIPLDNIGAITNTPRLAGSKSTVAVDITGIQGSVIAANFLRSVDDTGDQFQTTESNVLPIVGSQPLQITMEALGDGPIPAVAGTLNQGSLPAGVTTMTNPTDAALGSFDETDEEYRVGRKSRLASIGAATVVAIKAALLTVSGVNVNGVEVFENDTDVTRIDLTPALGPHSIRALVSGGADQDIIDSLGAKKGAGTFTDGTITGTFTDPTDGQTFTIRFSRVTDIEMYVTVSVLTFDSSYGDGTPANGDAAIKAAILALTWSVGEDVTLPKLQNAVTSIPGIITYTLFFDDAITPTTDTTVVIAEGEQGDFDTSRTIAGHI